MILLIFGIYAMIVANLHISKHYGLKGTGARIGGAVCIACSFGFFTIFSTPIITISQALGLGEEGTRVLGYVFQFAVLFMVLFGLIGIYGNSFAETTESPMSAEETSAVLGQIRWFHVVFAILMPYVAIPWGIVNILRRRRRSGIFLVAASIIIYTIVMAICIIASIATRGK
jgi:hypothetical protein